MSFVRHLNKLGNRSSIAFSTIKASTASPKIAVGSTKPTKDACGPDLDMDALEEPEEMFVMGPKGVVSKLLTSFLAT
jgi:hypothetical protein